METIATLVLLGGYAAALLLERLRPARSLPPVRAWMKRGVVFFAVAFAINAILPALAGPLLAPLAVLDLSFLGTYGGGLIAILLVDSLLYFVHRAMHRYPALWRWTHQLHHSAERVDTLGVTFFHPLDLVAQLAVPVIVGSVLGLPPDAIAIAGMFLVVTGLVQHVNTRTPVALGYFIQRPEAHSVHHARGVHAYNYGNLVIWDVLFGTYRNPDSFTDSAGFWDGASKLVGPMLIGVDVNDSTTRPRHLVKGHLA